MNIEDLNPDEAYTVKFEQQATSTDKFLQRRARMMLALITRLHDDPRPVRLGATVFGDELWLTASNVSFQVWIDAPDFANLVDGFPPYYYRIESDGKAFRSSSVDDAKSHIVELANA